DLRLGMRLALAVLDLLFLRLLLLAADLLKRLLHVRIEARTIAEVGIENMFHAISCWGSRDCFKAGLGTLGVRRGVGGLFEVRRGKFQVGRTRQSSRTA